MSPASPGIRAGPVSVHSWWSAKVIGPAKSLLGMGSAYSLVYLRSSSHKLPDLVAALNGQIDVELEGRIDTGPVNSIRTGFRAMGTAGFEPATSRV